MAQVPDDGFWTKITIYIAGALLGLASKLANLHKQKNMSKREFIARAFTAFACSWAVWQTLEYYNNLKVAAMLSVFVGRYGDEVIILIWKQLKETVNKFQP